MKIKFEVEKISTNIWELLEIKCNRTYKYRERMLLPKRSLQTLI
jgi:hypothetical protein